MSSQGGVRREGEAVGVDELRGGRDREDESVVKKAGRTIGNENLNCLAL